MKYIMVMVFSIFIAGCSVSKTTTVNLDKPYVNEKTNFTNLVTYVRMNNKSEPSQEVKNNINDMIFSAGLYNKCSNKECFLFYSRKNMKIKFDNDFITLEYSKDSYIKLDNVEKAAQIIYG